MPTDHGNNQPLTAEMLSAMRSAAQDKLDSLDIPRCHDIFKFSEALSAKRGLPLNLVPVTIGASSPCGVWLSTDKADIIAYEAGTSRPHQSHIIAHELGHIIHQHKGILAVSTNALNRVGHTEREEQEAEIMATVIQDSLRDKSVLQKPFLPSADETLGRMWRSLGRPHE